MAQKNNEQYMMPNALKGEKNYKYRVGYEATTGNETSPNHKDAGKTTKTSD